MVDHNPRIHVNCADNGVAAATHRLKIGDPLTENDQFWGQWSSNGSTFAQTHQLKHHWGSFINVLVDHNKRIHAKNRSNWVATAAHSLNIGNTLTGIDSIWGKQGIGS